MPLTKASPSLGRIPRHVAIIMDGNGRWAERKKRLRIFGHREGAKRVDEITTDATELGIKFLTLYAFSTENWNRPNDEVNMLMRLLLHHLKTMDKKLKKNRVSLVAQGTLERLPKRVRMELRRVIDLTALAEPRMYLNLCLSYGGRQEIVDSVRQIVGKVQAGELAAEDLCERDISQHLYQPWIPDPDLLIRTGGEYRVSNFLLWQIAYTEVFVSPVLWPDFRESEFREAVASFSRRERRFGKTSSQIKAELTQDTI